MTTRQPKKKPFSQIPNVVSDWLYHTESTLSLREIRVMGRVFRHTYGFHRKSAMLSSRYVASQTGMDKTHVNAAFKSLHRKGLLDVEIRGNYRYVTLCEKKYKLKKRLTITDDSGYIETDSVSIRESADNRDRFGLDTETDLVTKKERKRKLDLGLVDADEYVFDEHLSPNQSLSLSDEKAWEELRAFAASQPVDSMSPEDHRKLYQSFLKASGLGSVKLEHNEWFGGRPEDRGDHFDEDRRRYGPWDDEIF
jgi:phage replication O-like protein O